jgi:hypothetical protein
MEKGIIGGSQENFIPIRNLGRIHNLHNKGNKNERDRIQEKSIWKNTKEDGRTIKSEAMGGRIQNTGLERHI